MQRTTRRWVSGAALSAGVLMAAATPALAQTDDDETPTTAPAPAAPADEAPGGWIARILDQLVAAGTITQAQADAITQAVQDARPERAEHRGEHGPRGRFGVSVDAAAEALGIDVDELRTQLRDGATLAEIATAQGVDVQDVIDALTAAAKARLDDAVADGRITQEQADERLASATARLEELVNEPFAARGGHRHGRAGTGGEDRAEGTDESTPSSAPSTTEG